MARKIDKVAESLGAEIIAELPVVGGGAFGAARLASIIRSLKHRLKPSRGKRPGRPTDRRWNHRGKIPMSASTKKKLGDLAEKLSNRERKISPMQVAAEILEQALMESGKRR